MSDAALTASAPAANVRLHALRLLSDERLAHRVTDGAQDAFAALYERHHQALYRYCVGLLRNEEDAADCLQTTMLNAYRALSGPERELSVKPWLFRIAHNESISILRRRRTRTEAGEQPGDAQGRQELTLSTDAEAGTRERLRQLFSDMKELPERQRHALTMRELGGLDFAQIAAALETSTGAAKQVVFEARSALHAQAEGREMSHEEVQRALSEGDGRRVRGRKLRAHLRGCEQCRGYQEVLTARQSDLRAIAPLPAPIAVGILDQILGGGGNGGGGGFGGSHGSAGESLAPIPVLGALKGMALWGSKSAGGSGAAKVLGAGAAGKAFAGSTAGKAFAGSTAGKAVATLGAALAVGGGAAAVTELRDRAVEPGGRGVSSETQRDRMSDPGGGPTVDRRAERRAASGRRGEDEEGRRGSPASEGSDRRSSASSRSDCTRSRSRRTRGVGPGGDRPVRRRAHGKPKARVVTAPCETTRKGDRGSEKAERKRSKARRKSGKSRPARGRSRRARGGPGRAGRGRSSPRRGPKATPPSNRRSGAKRRSGRAAPKRGKGKATPGKGTASKGRATPRKGGG